MYQSRTIKEKKIKEFANTIYDLLKKNVPRSYVKRILYDNTRLHDELGIDEYRLDSIWEAIMENTFDRNHPTRIRKTYRKEPKELPPKDTQYKRVIVYNTITGEPLHIFESAYEAAVSLGVIESTIRCLCTSKAKRPRMIIRYEHDPIGDVILGKRKYTKNYIPKAAKKAAFFIYLSVNNAKNIKLSV